MWFLRAFFAREIEHIWDYMCQEVVRKEGGVEGGCGSGVTAASWEA